MCERIFLHEMGSACVSGGNVTCVRALEDLTHEKCLALDEIFGCERFFLSRSLIWGVVSTGVGWL